MPISPSEAWPAHVACQRFARVVAQREALLACELVVALVVALVACELVVALLSALVACELVVAQHEGPVAAACQAVVLSFVLGPSSVASAKSAHAVAYCGLRRPLARSRHLDIKTKPTTYVNKPYGVYSIIHSYHHNMLSCVLH